VTAPLLQSIDALLQRLLLGDRHLEPAGFPPDLLEYAETRTASVLGMTTEREAVMRTELRLRLALHLSPGPAVAYDPANPAPRHRLIETFITDHFGLARDEASPLARDVAHTLSIWDENRTSVTAHADRLLQSQSHCCAHCGVDFDNTPWTLSVKDMYKPYHESREELLQPEVDHIEAISFLGTNDLANLQVLCRLCNLGKGDGLGISVREELRQARTPTNLLPRAYRIRAFYATVLRDKKRCKLCGNTHSNSELTVRLRHARGSYVRSNLHTVCVPCARQSNISHSTAA
jgi:5-methylcytosine-specific restriction endonuclease McrA